MGHEVPQINRDSLRRYSYYSESTRQLITDLIEAYDITPDNHPRVADLAAGDGSIAAILHEKGWLERNITCVDLCISPEPLVPGSKWIHQDLLELAHILSSGGGVVPQKISKVKASFDIISIYQSPLRPWEEQIISQYLARNSYAFVLATSHMGYVK